MELQARAGTTLLARNGELTNQSPPATYERRSVATDSAAQRRWHGWWLLGLQNDGRQFAMRLSSKIFLSSAIVIAVLTGVAISNLGALSRLVSVNREIITRTMPAIGLATSARDAIPRLQQLEARALVLGDGRYLTAWTETAAQVADILDQLAEYPLSEQERRYHREAGAAFAAYQRLVAEEQALLQRGDRAHALALTDAATRVRADQVRTSLESLMAATRTQVVMSQAEAARLETRTWFVVLMSLNAAVGLALVGAAIVARRMTRSLERLSSATAAVAAGAFRDPIVIDTRDEIGSLTASFNVMASQLRQMEQAKQEFFATVSHELRSPLTSIGGAVHLLQGEGDPLTANQKRLTDIVSQSCERLLRLANQILEMSRLRAGAAPLDRQAVDLMRIVERVVEELHPQAEKAGVALESERSGRDFAYFGDEEKLYQLVVNLGANAIRFTPRGGRVVIRIIEAGSDFELQVEDTGVGIPPEALPEIFDPYRQAHRNHGGTGLGLAIVHGIAKAHGGCVTAESQEGKGSRFTVLLPR
jgi:signal transduction histidine kinase